MKTPLITLSRGYRSQFSFNLRHAITAGPAKDRHSHGHDYELIVYVKGPVNPKSGFVLDAAELKRMVMELVVLPFDGQDANEFLVNPTSENLIVEFWRRLKPALPNLNRLDLWETPKICVSYEGEEVEIDE